MSWLSDEEKKAIYEAYEAGQRIKAENGIKGVARRFNVHPRTVQKIIEEERAQKNAHPVKPLAFAASS